jgi:two-component system NtrC family sensor kinase
MDRGSGGESDDLHDLSLRMLRERVKELSCLYAIARIAGEPGLSLGSILERIANLLPPAWQYTEIASGQIILDGDEFLSSGFDDRGARQSAPILVNGERRGQVEVIYREERPELDEGPFLAEERNLIDAVAGQVALIIERKLAGEEREQLQEQLRHADRLATIGQLAAGVAHELNEPLAGILGFAQLARKAPGLPEAVAVDLDKIVKASLHAREVVKKLMLFARQSPLEKAEADLNRLVKEGLYFVESQCLKAGVELIRELADGMPRLVVDKGQLHQVLVNLVVNAVQAMPDGGRLVIRTAVDGQEAVLAVTDTGRGMDETTRKRMFVPFFTTKEVNEGTGLGLAVVHGIVSSHGGTVRVESEPGRGTTVEIRLPFSARGVGEEGAPADEDG